MTAWIVRARRAASNPTLRRVAVAGIILLSFLFLTLSIQKAGASALRSGIDGRSLAGLLGCGAAYAGLLALLARGWSLIPASAGRAIRWREAIAVYGLSILPKYFPGSILHYGSRQVLGGRCGWEGALMAKASVIELALHVLCSAGIASLLLLFGREIEMAKSYDWYAGISGVAALGALAAILLCLRGLSKQAVLGSALYQLVFFAGLASLAMICGALARADVALLPVVAGLVLISWLIALIVPIAPGGLGVREAAGIALLSPVVGVQAAVLISLAMRLVTLAGDALLFLLALLGAPGSFRHSSHQTRQRSDR